MRQTENTYKLWQLDKTMHDKNTAQNEINRKHVQAKFSAATFHLQNFSVYQTKQQSKQNNSRVATAGMWMLYNTITSHVLPCISHLYNNTVKGNHRCWLRFNIIISDVYQTLVQIHTAGDEISCIFHMAAGFQMRPVLGLT